MCCFLFVAIDELDMAAEKNTWAQPDSIATISSMNAAIAQQRCCNEKSINSIIISSIGRRKKEAAVITMVEVASQ